MATQTITVQITIPEDLYHRIEEASGRPVDDVIVELVEDRFAVVANLDRHVRGGKGRDEDNAFDPDAFMREMGLEPLSVEDRQRILQDMPVLDPPLSQTIIDEREDRL